MTKNLSKISFVFLASLFLSGTMVFAQSPTLEKAVENVKDQVDDLVVAKDEKNPNDFALRVEAFKKVIDLSLAEAKELKVKLLTLELPKEEAFSAWKENMLSGLNLALDQYTKEEELFSKDTPTSLSSIKESAENFKKWREENYLGLANQINDFLLLEQEGKAIETALKRASKIGEDVSKLQRSKLSGLSSSDETNLKTLLEKARGSINEATDLNKEAHDAFLKEFVFIGAFAPTSSMASSSVIELSIVSTNNVTSTATSTSEASESEAALLPPPSIRDLVRSSLSKIKEGYQIFIEMSNLVRKLLI